MSHPVRPDPSCGRRMTRAVSLFVLAVLAVLGAILWVILGSGRAGEASAAQSITVLAAVLAVLAVVPYVFVAHARLTWRYRCPQCGTRLRTDEVRPVDAPIRHRCDTCRVDWDTGWRVGRRGGD